MMVFDICVYEDDDMCDDDMHMYNYSISSVTKIFFVTLLMVFILGAVMDRFSENFAGVFVIIFRAFILENIIRCLDFSQSYMINFFEYLKHNKNCFC